MMSDDLDEVDWEFSGNNFGGSTGVVQTNYFGKGITGDYDRGTQPSVDSPQTEFHTYTYDWSAESLTWSIDGTVVRTLLAADEDDSYHQYPQTPVQLHLGLWDAGAPNTSASTVNWAGGYTDLSQAPFTMYVKSVKIVPSNACATYAYGDMSGTWQSIKCGNSSSSVSGGMSVTSSSSSSSTAAAKTAQSATTTTSTKSTILSHGTHLPSPGHKCVNPHLPYSHLFPSLDGHRGSVSGSTKSNGDGQYLHDGGDDDDCVYTDQTGRVKRSTNCRRGSDDGE